MASKSLCLSILLTLFIVNEVRSGIILDGIDKTIKGTKCTLHKIGEKLYQHQHESDPCEDQENVSENFDENANKIEKLYDDVGKKGENVLHPSSDSKSSSSSTSGFPSVQRPNRGDDTQGHGQQEGDATGEDGRRLINPGANCPEGYRADKSGTCYLVY